MQFQDAFSSVQSQVGNAKYRRKWGVTFLSSSTFWPFPHLIGFLSKCKHSCGWIHLSSYSLPIDQAWSFWNMLWKNKIVKNPHRNKIQSETESTQKQKQVTIKKVIVTFMKVTFHLLNHKPLNKALHHTEGSHERDEEWEEIKYKHNLSEVMHLNEW